jgi:very-short-patch-repair endonuclease
MVRRKVGAWTMRKSMRDPATLSFIRRAKAMHGSKYGYSRSIYKGCDTKLVIICPKHGPFRQTPYHHTSPPLGHGCRKCGALRAASKQSAVAGKKFIQRARARHGQKYDYSKVDYNRAHSKVCIICPVHGKFWQQADSHIRSCGCPTCGKNRGGKQRRDRAGKLFVSKARKIHGRKYDYSETHYSLSRVAVVIRCPRHGPFLQSPNSHLSGNGCSGCHREDLRAQFAKGFANFRRDARAVHGNRFSYVNDYVNSKTPVTIKCRKHGLFKQAPTIHLRGAACPQCGYASHAQTRAMTHREFVAKAKRVHRRRGFTYRESYSRAIKKLGIRCPIHGIFRQTPNSHLGGAGCPGCSSDASAVRMKSNHKAFLQRARQVHGNRFQYPQQYETANTLMNIVCRAHGRFLQLPTKHLQGQGCPSCLESFGERSVALALKRMRVGYVREKGFPTCRDIGPLLFDFFIPKLKLLLEYDGQQHFQTVGHWGGDKSFKRTVRRDSIKTKWAKRHGYRLIRIPYTTRNIPHLLKAELF